MKPASANLLNAFILIAAGFYGYAMVPKADGAFQLEALIPAGFGVLLLILYTTMAAGNRVVSHIAVMITLVLLIAAIWKFAGSAEWNPRKYIILIIIISNAIAMLFFILSFINARKNKIPTG